MKKLMVTAATAAEIEQFVQYLKDHFECIAPWVFRNQLYEIHIIISGVGMMQCAFSLSNAMALNKYDAAVQAGIAGAFDANFQLGDLVQISTEQYGDLGAEDHQEFINIFDLGFLNNNQHPFLDGKLCNLEPYNWGNNLPKASAISVNTVSGNKDSIDKRTALFKAQTESMEGIAFHYSCLIHQVPFVQIRAISNYVTPRNKANWQIKKAIDNLNQHLIKQIL